MLDTAFATGVRRHIRLDNAAFGEITASQDWETRLE
jgi:hypothetical protein